MSLAANYEHFKAIDYAYFGKNSTCQHKFIRTAKLQNGVITISLVNEVIGKQQVDAVAPCDDFKFVEHHSRADMP